MDGGPVGTYPLTIHTLSVLEGVSVSLLENRQSVPVPLLPDGVTPHSFPG